MSPLIQPISVFLIVAPILEYANAYGISSSRHRADTKNCTCEFPDINPKGPACQYPLVATNDSSQWLANNTGCTLSCKYPITDVNGLFYYDLVKGILSLVGLVASLLAITMIVINKTKDSRTPIVKVVKIYTVCHLVNYLGWSLQIFTGGDVACSPEGTNLIGLPLRANTCVISFILTYISTLCSKFCFAYLGILFHKRLEGKSKNSLQAADNSDRVIESFIYLMPALIFVMFTSLGQIDGNGLNGICTVGQQSTLIKTIFVLMPDIICVSSGSFYYMATIYCLMSTKSTKPSVRRSVARITMLTTMALLQTFSSIAVYFLESKPITALYYLNLIAILSEGLVISSFAFHKANFRAVRYNLLDLLIDANYIKHMKGRMSTFLDYSAQEDLRNYEIDLPTSTPENVELNDRDRATPSSLSSVQLDLNSNNISRRNSRILNMGGRARDIIEDQRQLNQSELVTNAFPDIPNPSNLQDFPPVMLNILENFFQMMHNPNQAPCLYEINPEFLGSQTAPASKPQFIHCMGTNGN